MSPRRAGLTGPDLVVLSILCEQPMHGYHLVRELERREVGDWAGISRPQVYYSLQKLAREGLIEQTEDRGDPTGPDRVVYSITRPARAALADALAQESWATQRPPPPFTTWLALSPHARRADARRLLERRRKFLREQIAKERATIDSIRAEHGPALAVAIVDLAIRQFELELEWLENLRTDGRPS